MVREIRMNKRKGKISKENILEKISGRVAVFIDAANLEKSVMDLGTKPPQIKRIPKEFHWKALPKGHFKVDYKKLYKLFKENSELVSISFYSARFNTKSHDDFLTFLKRNKYRLITKLVKEISVNATTHIRKANFDVEIAVDAVAWIRNYDICVLFSGDSDFAYLLSFLKRKKKKVIVISERGHVSKELVKVADIYKDLHAFKEDFIVVKTQKSRS